MSMFIPRFLGCDKTGEWAIRDLSITHDLPRPSLQGPEVRYKDAPNPKIFYDYLQRRKVTNILVILHEGSAYGCRFFSLDLAFNVFRFLASVYLVAPLSYLPPQPYHSGDKHKLCRTHTSSNITPSAVSASSSILIAPGL